MSQPGQVPVHAAALAEMRDVLHAPDPQEVWWSNLTDQERAIFARGVGRPEVADLAHWYGIRTETRGEILSLARRWAQWAARHLPYEARPA